MLLMFLCCRGQQHTVPLRTSCCGECGAACCGPPRVSTYNVQSTIKTVRKNAHRGRKIPSRVATAVLLQALLKSDVLVALACVQNCYRPATKQIRQLHVAKPAVRQRLVCFGAS